MGSGDVIFRFPAPTNHLLSLNTRLDRWKRASYAAVWRKAAWAHALNQQLAPQARAHVQVSLPVQNLGVKRDPGNFTPTSKPVIDGMVDAGVWPGDDPRWVMEIMPTFHDGKDVIVTISPIEDDDG